MAPVLSKALAVALLASSAWSACRAAIASPDFQQDGALGQKTVFGLPPSHNAGKNAFIDSLIANMTLDDLVLQLHLVFGDDLVGAAMDDKQYERTMRFSPDSPVGAIHDFYSLNTSRHNDLQRRNLETARLPIPFLHCGECLHGVGSFQQSLFPQSLGLAASFDADLVYRVGRAIATEARSIGVHACFAPVLDLAWDPRWGRSQEGWGEDKVLTTRMGVAFALGLSKNGSLSEPDAVVPVVKHFAAHGSPESGLNAAPFVGHGMRQVVQELLMPFKAAIELGSVRGVMMAYNELDSIPAAVHPVLYDKLREWGFDGFVIADDTAIQELQTVHRVAASPADAIGQWFNAGGMIQFYDYSLEEFLNATKTLVASGAVALSTLEAHVRKILSVKWDLGLFQHPFIADDIDPARLVADHRALVLEAAQKSIVLLKNANGTLPLAPAKIALLGPFADTLNYGDYSGTWGQVPATAGSATTLHEALSKDFSGLVRTSWGADSWEYPTQNVVPPYRLATPDGTPGGLRATYFPHTDFSASHPHSAVELPEPQVPALDWGLFPPPGLPSNNFSAVWEGSLMSPADDEAIDAWIGVAVGPYSAAKLYIDDLLVVVSGTGNATSSDHSLTSTIQGNILPWSFVEQTSRNQTESSRAPPGAAAFTFSPHTTYRLRIEFQAWGASLALRQNVNALRSQMLLFWNLARDTGPAPNDTALGRAVALAQAADIVVVAVGAAWNSDGENADRFDLALPPSQDALVEAVLNSTAAPVVLVLFGGRPFAIPQHYARAAAVVSAFFPGPAGGQAIADVLLGRVDPGGARLPRAVPRSVGQLPTRYEHKPSAARPQYVDATRNGTAPCFPFGHGLSYTTFSVSSFSSSTPAFSSGSHIVFSARIHNTGTVAGSYTMQVYLLGRVSAVTQPVRQLVAFHRVYLEAGESMDASTPAVDVDRYLQILDRHNRLILERGEYEFALREDGGNAAQEHGRLTLTCT